MLGIQFIIAVVFIIVALLGILVVIVRASKYNRNWKVIEPELIKKAERSIGQKIVHKMMLNANESTDFSKGKGFWLWLAFTADYTVFADRNLIAGGGSGYLCFSKRTDTSMKQLEKRFAELEFKDIESSGKVKFTVLVRSCDREVLNKFIPVKRN